MSPEQKTQYLAHVTTEIERAETVIAELESARNEAEGKMHSRYDTQREEANTRLNIATDLLEKERRFRDEIEGSDWRYQVESGAFLDLLINGEPKQCLFMENNGTLPDIQVITPKSPIGSAIAGKIPGETGSYTISGRKFKVEVKSIL